jgi:predicted DNA-binding transcriptional regulator AlpA
MKNLIDKEQTAKLLDITVKTLELWMSEKYGPKPKWIGKIVRFEKAEVETFATKLLAKDKTKKPHSPIGKK